RLDRDRRSAGGAGGVRGVEFPQPRRDIYAELPELVHGRIGFEPNALTYARFSTLTAGGLELVPRHGLVEAMRAVKDQGELDTIRRAPAGTSRGFAQIAEERVVGRG